MPPIRPTPLAHLVANVEEAFDHAFGDGAWLVRVEGAGTEAEMGFHRLDDGVDHPVEGLLGFRADPSWSAVGVVVHGLGRTLGPEAGDGEPEERRRIRCVYAVARDGTEASAVRYLDRGDLVGDAGPPEGRMVDCCRRVLGLRTGPPPCDPLHLHAAEWLDTVLAAVAEAPTRRWTWPQVAVVHSLVPRGRVLPSTMARAVEQASRQRSWADLRAATAGGTDVRRTVDAEVAAWMDDGMFAREVLAAAGDPVDLVIELAALLPPSITEAIVEVLVAWAIW